ncbi:hypothetical protein [Serratia quinivorans]|uniref:hypothetical protein n=1 Tax=Serratia quinivorans TaxID=137545 RepID=UPI002E7A7033|nr:hypothetical protein [Serratia quinivorans]
MNITFDTDHIIINNEIILSKTQKRKDIITKNQRWEDWLRNGNNEVVSYRIKLSSKGRNDGNVYLITTFTNPINDESLLCSWFLAPENLIEGVQNKPEGKVTARLRKWFFEKTKEKPPIGNDSEYIDASYDPWNSVGMIFCNYRSGFKNDKDWKEFRKNNKF